MVRLILEDRICRSDKWVVFVITKRRIVISNYIIVDCDIIIVDVIFWQHIEVMETVVANPRESGMQLIRLGT